MVAYSRTLSQAQVPDSKGRTVSSWVIKLLLNAGHPSGTSTCNIYMQIDEYIVFRPGIAAFQALPARGDDVILGKQSTSEISALTNVVACAYHHYISFNPPRGGQYLSAVPLTEACLHEWLDSHRP